MPRIKSHTPRLQRLKQTTFKTKLLVLLALVFVLGGYTYFRVSRAATPYTNFVDISSPQCSSLEGKKFQQFGIVGLNGTYMNFGTNPCLLNEVRLFAAYDLYVGANYPSGPCGNISPYDCGRKAGQYNLDVIRWYSLRPTKLWIDVETGPGIPWSTPANNWNFLSGMHSVLKTKYAVGFYSNQNMWQQVTGNIDLSQKITGGSLNWYATGRTNEAEARSFCNVRFGNSLNQYVQYVYANKVDFNVAC